MIAEFKKHHKAYIVLILILLIFSLLFLHYWPNRDIQRFLIIFMSSFYFFWGVMVHSKMNKLHRHVIFEYLSVSLLAGSVLFLLTF